ncbi:MAG: universal stress protein [Acidimicrobiia bacterium]|jgi:nucleotide-binding universal stress UspA family protein
MERSVWNPKVIVIGVDGSEHSRHAARVAVAIARQNDAVVHLVTVVRPPEGWWGIVGSPPTPTALSRSLADAQREILDLVLSDLDLSGVEHVTVEEVGDPGRTLIQHAEEADADLLVLGTRGAGLIERIMLGSVASRVSQDAPCPVLLVP